MKDMKSIQALQLASNNNMSGLHFLFMSTSESEDNDRLNSTFRQGRVYSTLPVLATDLSLPPVGKRRSEHMR